MVSLAQLYATSFMVYDEFLGLQLYFLYNLTDDKFDTLYQWIRVTKGLSEKFQGFREI